jgi:uncharacterized protein (TIGR03086 family)
MTAASAVDDLTLALEATGDLIAGVRSDQWSARTPCSDWDVRALSNHLVFGMRRYIGILRGDPPLPIDDLPRLRAVDQLGDDPVRAYREAGSGLLAAADQPDLLGKTFTIPLGTVPGAIALHILTTEILVHGWDVARATGQPARLPESVAERELAFTRRQLPPDAPRSSPAFGPAQRVADDAPAIDRLAGYLGRHVPAEAAASS